VASVRFDHGGPCLGAPIEPRLRDRNGQERGCHRGSLGLRDLPCLSDLHRDSSPTVACFHYGVTGGALPYTHGVRVLSLIHHDNAPTGTFADAVRKRNGELLEWNVVNGFPPAPAETFDAVFIFGGGMHVDQEDHHPWLREEDALVKTLLAEQVPVFGVCLGGQLIAKAAGAHVGPAPREEVGWHEVELTPEARSDPVFAGVPARFEAFQWHEYSFELPNGATPLAQNDVGLQAYRLGDFAWGIQFHAEVTQDILEDWARSDGRPGFDSGPMERWSRLGRSLAERFLDVAARRLRRARREATPAS
jgi:GMP synthase (glutamine-hydrolysing)